MKKLPFGQENFRDVILSDYYYVDKTKYIEQIINDGATFLLFARPRRFGKSLFLSTLNYFFNIENNKENKKLFKGLYIEKSDCFKEMGKYPVIYLNFKDLKKNSYEEFYKKFVTLIRILYTKNEFIINVLNEGEKRDFINIRDGLGSKNNYTDSLLYLIIWLERYYKERVVILIDEYDVPIHEGYLNGYYDEVVGLIREFLSPLKGENNIRLVVFTGVLRVSKESLFSDLNNILVYTMMDKDFSDTFGFTESETKEFLEDYGLKLTKEIKDYYDGYNIKGVSLYNPWSIINYIKKKELLPYWVNTSGNVLIQDLISKMKEENKAKIFDLLEGESKNFRYNEKLTYNDFNEYNNINTALNLLYASGYLTYDKTVNDMNYYKIPNNEVKESLAVIMQRAIFNGDLTEEENANFIENILNKDTEKVEIYLNELLKSLSFFDLVNEQSYHNFMLGLLFAESRKYIIKSNRESGTGRSDIIIEDNKRERGIIVELKVAKKESEIKSKIIEAKKQIKKNKYLDELELDKVKDKKEMVIVFYKKKVVVNG